MPPVGTKKNGGDTAVADAPAPDTVREEEGEKSLEDVLVDDFKEDGGVRIHDESGKQVKDPVAYLLGLRDAALQAAKLARSAGITFENRTGVLASRMLDVRRSIIRPETGKPDWGGTTKTYKDTVAPIREAAMIPGETPATAGNRLQRRCTRMLGEYIAAYVNDTRKIGIDEEDLPGIVRSGEKTLENKDETVQALVSAVNEEYRVGQHADNEPYSPFEMSKTAQRTATATRDEQAASEAARTLNKLSDFVKVVTLDVVTGAIVKLSQTVAQAAVGPEPKFGKGRAVVARNCLAAANILYGAGAHLSEQKLSKEQEQSFDKAMALEV